MPSRPRRNVGQFIFHVCNRAIQTLVLFESPADYEVFLRVVQAAADRFAMRILAYTVMPNHWHFIVWPTSDSSLSAFMQWLSGTHARRWREERGSGGRGALYQGRFKAIPIQQDAHLVRACRYVERNALRARLVGRAEDWPWTSASPLATAAGRPVLSAWPIPRPDDWLATLNLPEPRRELTEVRRAIAADRPLGTTAWRSHVRSRLSWRMPSRPPGRPPTSPQEAAVFPTIS